MATLLADACVAETFSPSIFGADILNIGASLVTNYSSQVPEVLMLTQPAIDVQNATFCNITVAYTHPGQDDRITVEAWLPVDNWNGLLQAVSGSGWAAGRIDIDFLAMAGAMGLGYATITTDAGLIGDVTSWALLSPGNVNLYNLQNLASVSLNDEALIGKSLIKSFYGTGPKYSYWNGCSQGGRQGLMLAQRYPKAYDGIVAGGPAIYWTELLPSIRWPYQEMLNVGAFPPKCEFDALTAAAIAACDKLDGVVDGIVSNPEDCLASFDPFHLVGKVLNCTQGASFEKVKITTEAATIIQATWNGRTNAKGEKTWFGLHPSADLTGNRPTLSPGLPILNTECKNGTCIAIPDGLSEPWYQLFLAKDPKKDLTTLTHAEFDELTRSGREQYRSMIETDDTDLSRFKKAGGKMVSFHGLDDDLISPMATEKYYKDVAAGDPDVHDFYRYYEVPGMGHCVGGLSHQPTSLFGQLRAWVENGTAPESTPVKLNVTGGHVHDRILCPYPKKAQLSACDNPAIEKCWECAIPAGRT